MYDNINRTLSLDHENLSIDRIMVQDNKSYKFLKSVRFIQRKSLIIKQNMYDNINRTLLTESGQQNVFEFWARAEEAPV